MLDPQLAKELPNFPGKDDKMVLAAWVMEPKFDGIRLLAHVGLDGQVDFWTREGNRKQLPRIAAELSTLPPNTVLDGEAVSIDDVWEKAQSGVQSGQDAALRFMYFDVLMFNGLDTCVMPFAQRRDFLKDIVASGKIGGIGDTPPARVLLTPQMEATRENYDLLLHIGFEGAMLKLKSALYKQGRSSSWRKLKAFSTIDAIVTGYEPGKDVGTVIFSQYDVGGNLVQRGRCKALKGIHEGIEERIACQQVIEVKHNGVMRSGALRHPQIVRVRDDKPPRECQIST